MIRARVGRGGAAAVAVVKMRAGMKLSRHARTEMRLYGIALDDVESAVGDPVARDVDDRGNTRLTGRTWTVGLSFLW
jgi:hypothetical protein